MYGSIIISEIILSYSVVSILMAVLLVLPSLGLCVEVVTLLSILSAGLSYYYCKCKLILLLGSTVVSPYVGMKTKWRLLKY